MPILTAEAASILNDEFVGVTWYIGLRSSGVELSGDGYDRVAYDDWVSTLTNIMSNPTTFAFDQATADWLEADEVALYAESSGGSPKYTASLDPPVTVRTGQTRSFPASALTIKIIPVI